MYVRFCAVEGVLEVSSARSKLDGVLQTLVEKKDEGFVVVFISTE